MYTLEKIRRALPRLRVEKHPQRHEVKRSAVVIMLREGDACAEVLMMKRAERDGDPWSGHMGFPGGRQEPGDASTFATAAREVREEMGFEVEAVADAPVRLSDIRATGRGRVLPLVVTPYLMFAQSEIHVVPNEEVAESMWIPLHFFAPGKRQSFELVYDGQTYNMPCYYYQQYRIWGLSLRMLDELLEVL